MDYCYASLRYICAIPLAYLATSLGAALGTNPAFVFCGYRVIYRDQHIANVASSLIIAINVRVSFYF